MIRRTTMQTLLVVIAASGSLVAQVKGTGRGRIPVRQTETPTPDELRSFGENQMRAILNRYGEVKDPRIVAMVGEVIDPLRRVSGYNNPNFKWYVVGDTEVNAQAITGGFMRVNLGLIKTFQKIVEKEIPKDAAKQDQRLRAYLAAVLGHELAHLALGHTDSVDLLRKLPPRGNPQTREALLEQAMRDPANLEKQKHTRAQELAADRTGAWFDLRAGWTIQDAMDLFRDFDSLERAEPQALDDVSWLRDHPRASQREAALESFRAELKLDQGRYDDAYTLVNRGVMLDTAVTLLDSVIAHFPELKEPRQLKAAAFQRAFMRNATPSQLMVRSGVGTYEARFLPGIRGAASFTPAAAAALSKARDAYAEALSHGRLAYSLANLAVLDAYAGDTKLALARADSAVAMQSDDGLPRLNRGVVRYLAHDLQGALADFRAVQAKIMAPSIVTFNIGRTMVDMGTAAGRDTLRAYAQADEEGEWHDEALRLAGGGEGGNVTPAGGVKPIGKTNPSPARDASGIAVPVGIGARAAEVRAALGAPEEARSSSGSTIWIYRERGILVVLSPSVSVIGLLKAGAGAIDGVRVGDPISKARTAWRKPVDMADGMLYFRRGNLIVAVETDGSSIQMLSIGTP